MRYILLIILLLLPTVSHGQPKPPAKQPPTSGVVVREGHKGMWFPMDKAKQLLKDIKTGKANKALLEKTEARLSLEKTRSILLEKNVKTSENIADVWKGTAESQAKIISQKDSWWKSPYLWTVVGFVVGTATTVGITFAVNRSGASK